MGQSEERVKQSEQGEARVAHELQHAHFPGDLTPPKPEAASTQRGGTGSTTNGETKDRDWVRIGRMAAAGTLAILSIFGFAGIIFLSAKELTAATAIASRNTPAANLPAAQYESLVRYHVAVFSAGVIAHAIVAVAAALFCYQIMRVAERLFLPYSLLNPENVEVLRALVGIETPVDRAKRLVEDMVKLQGALSKSDDKKKDD